MAGVFISYRRDDSAGFAGALERDLASRLGPELVFMDIKDIEGGTEFPVAIDEALKSSEVVIVLIGSRWLDARDGRGNRRLEKPDDFVRQEVARALESSARVVPLLLDGTQLPAADQLPSDLVRLTTARHWSCATPIGTRTWPRCSNHVREGMFALNLEGTADKKIGADFNPMAPRSRALNWLLRAMLTIGVLFLGLGSVSFISQVRFLARATKTNARVVDLLRERSDQGGDVYRPQLEFVIPARQTVRTTLASLLTLLLTTLANK